MDEAEEGDVIAVDGLVEHVDEFHAVFSVVEVEDAVGNHVQYDKDMVVVAFADVFQVDVQHLETFFSPKFQYGNIIEVFGMVLDVEACFQLDLLKGVWQLIGKVPFGIDVNHGVAFEFVGMEIQ